MRLNNKNIVVTAAAQGIGKSTALAFAKEGANVIATDINFEKLKELKEKENNILIQKLDSTDLDQVKKFSASIDKVDVLFHAVGFVHNGTIFGYLGISELQDFGLHVEHHQHMLYRLLAWVAVRGLLDQRQQCMGRHFELLLGGGPTSVSFCVVRPVPAKAWVSHFGQREPSLI